MIKRIYFYYESSGVGGAQLLFARLARFLDEQGQSVGYICPPDAFLRLELNQIRTIDYISKEDVCRHCFGDDDIIVTVLSYIFKVKELKIKNSAVRAFFWDVHPFNYIEYMAFSYFYKKNSILTHCFKIIENKSYNIFRENLNTLTRNSSVAFMCRKNLEYNECFFNLELEEKYLPICINEPDVKYLLTNPPSINNQLRIGWLSRLDKDKVVLLDDFLSSLEQASFLNIQLYIIGEGENENDFQAPRGIEIIKTGRLTGNKLDQFIINNIDCAFAVGTAALEFAKLGIPTFLIPGNDSLEFYKTTRAKYIPLHKISGYDVAVEQYHKSKTIPIEKCLSLVESYNNERDQFRAYVMQRHSIEKVSEKLLEYLENNNQTIASVAKMYNRDSLGRLLDFAKRQYKRFR